MKIKFLPVCLALTLVAGCESNPDFDAVKPTAVESSDTLDKAPEDPTRAPQTVEDSWPDEPEETWTTEDTSGEDPEPTPEPTPTPEPEPEPEPEECFLADGINVAIFNINLVHIDDKADCEEQWPVENPDQWAGWRGICGMHAYEARLDAQDEAISECFVGESVQFWHEATCAGYVALDAQESCLKWLNVQLDDYPDQGIGAYQGRWDACKVAFDDAYTEAFEGECAF